ncbi:MAG: MucR family transcriptional regulator [Amylibacter sp.]|jgi:predicted transcriptional regulator|nr:MucR family transcriptional regulator [Amylibacter sp.]
MKMEDIREDSAVMKYTTDIVSAFIQGNKVEVSEISDIMDTVHAKVVELCRAGGTRALTTKPAVAVEDSVTPDHIICLEDGKSFKMLKKHLKTKYDLSPEEYRSKWSLPADYPMVAPNYAIKRQELAKASGLGRSR